jgi:DNA-binding SARP family transcriptional activator/TolB-like protein/Tfp pilus assembly protein PilF
MNSGSAFHLGLFGNRSLVAPDGTSLTGQAVQRHRIALLALLTMAASRGLSREKLMGYLWPERETEHGRQLLNQAVYNLRKALGEDAIISEGDEVRLNLEVVRADVADFEAAMARRDHAEAVSLYSGPFLDGFSLSDAPDFEWWADRERQRLAIAHAHALEALAETAAKDGDLRRAIDWWKVRAAQDPYDSRVAVRLMEALAASGSHAAALQHAKVHERLLQTEFGAAPSPEVIALAERLRTTPPSAPSNTELAFQRADPQRLRPTAPSSQLHRVGASRSPPTRAIRYALGGLAFAGMVAVVALLPRVPRNDALAVAARERSIAVLPLANLSSDVRDASLADGMTEELIGALANGGGLRVIASTSVFGFRDHTLDVRRIADSLHVGHVVEGDVQKSGSRLRVRVRLVDAGDGSTRWSETYDRELRDIFAVQDDIARSVVRELGPHLAGVASTPNNRHQTHNIAAYELYLRGNNPVLLRSDSGAQAAVDYFRQAIALDSTYAAAYAGLARIYLRLGLAGAANGSQRDRLALAERSAEKALALDDSLADGHAALGLVRSARFDLGSAESHLKRAVDLEPTGAAFHEWLGQLYVFVGRPADALSEDQRALELDPLSPSANAELGRSLLANGRPDDALAQLQKVAALQPPLLRANIIAAQAYMKKGMWAQAISVLHDRNGPLGLAHIGYALAHSGQREAARRVRDTLVERWHRDMGGAIEVALVSAGLGDFDQAFAWLDRAIAGGSVNAEGTELLFDDLRRDPRFERVRDRMGLQKR